MSEKVIVPQEWWHKRVTDAASDNRSEELVRNRTGVDVVRGDVSETIDPDVHSETSNLLSTLASSAHTREVFYIAGLLAMGAKVKRRGKVIGALRKELRKRTDLGFWDVRKIGKR